MNADKMQSNSEQESRDDENNSSQEESGDRFNEDLLKDVDCNLMFLDDADEHLPEIFDVSAVKQELKDECKLCQEQFVLIKRSRHHCRKCGASVCDLCSQSQRRLSKKDKAKHRVCDVCDHVLSNVQFSQNLSKDLQKRKQIGKKVQQEISEEQKNFNQLKLENEKQQKILEQKKKEVEQEEQQMVEKLKLNQNRLQTIDQTNEDLKRQLEMLNQGIDVIQSDLQNKEKVIKQLSDERSKVKDLIQKYNSELKDKREAMLKVKKLDYDKVFNNNPQNIIGGQIDKNLIKEWQNRDSDSDEYSNDQSNASKTYQEDELQQISSYKQNEEQLKSFIKTSQF